MLSEPKRFVKRVGCRTAGVTAEHEFVASRFGAKLPRLVHHLLADTPALELRKNAYVLNNARRRTEVSEVVHDQQGKRADDGSVNFGDEQPVTRVAGEPL